MSRKTLKRDVLADGGLRDDRTSAFWTVKLVHPIDAIQWLATGKFYSQPVEPVRSWMDCLEGESNWEVERENGRIDLSAELVTHAVETGRLRCAYVVRSEHQPDWGGVVLPRLEIITAEEFAGAEVSHSWDDGFSLSVHRSADDDDYGISVENFFFFWDELALLRPTRRAEDDGPSELAPPRSDAAWLRSSPVAETAGRRGRRPRRYGAPIAAFLARAVGFGLDEAAAEKDEVLGRWLIEEFERLGDPTPPDLRNAAADARGALTAWKSAVAQKLIP